MTTMYRGKLQGQPGPQHVRELLPRASKPMPSGNGLGCPDKDFTGRRRNDDPISEVEIAHRKNRRAVEREKFKRAQAKREGKK